MAAGAHRGALQLAVRIRRSDGASVIFLKEARMDTHLPTRGKIEKMYHFAFPCRDAEETRAFYEDVLGLPLVHCMEVQSVPSSGDPGPYAHIFFEMRDGSYLAFFDLGKNEKPAP